MRRLLLPLIALCLALAACDAGADAPASTFPTSSPDPTTTTVAAGPDGRLIVVVEVPAGIYRRDMEDAATVLAARLQAAVPSSAVAPRAAGQRIQVVIVGPGLSEVPDAVIAEALAGGAVSFRPVLAKAQGTTAAALGDAAFAGVTLDGRGLSPADNGAAQVVYADASGGFVYLLGPAVITAADIVAVTPVDPGGDGRWVVSPMRQPSGSERFRAVTGDLAAIPVDDPRRAIAISINGVVVSAPMLATDVGPAGLDPDVVTISPPDGNNEDDAAALAALLSAGSIPFEFTLVSISRSVD